MSVCRRSRASQALLWGALIVTAVSSRGPVAAQGQEPAMRWDGLIELVSGRNEYPPPNLNPPIPADGPSQMSRHAVSGDGRYVVFIANAPSLGNYGPALYLRDRRLSDTRLIFAGVDTSRLRDAVISEDGRHVAFTMCEPWIRPDYTPICDVWAMDTVTGAWAVLSVSPETGEFGNADSDEPVLSGNGRFVVFRTAATNLAPGVPVGVPQLVIKDRDPDGNGIYDEPGPISPHSFQIVSVPKGNQGSVPGNAPSATAEVSDNGRYVAFRSAASNLVPGDTNGQWDVFRRDRLSRDTRRLNVQVTGGQSPDAIDSPGISMTPDGRYVAFASADPMLAPAPFDDTNTVRDVYVYDAQSFNVQRVDVGWLPYATGVLVPGSGPTEWPTLSADGRYVAVQSAAMNVEVAPPPNSIHTYVVDRFLNKATRVSIKPDGTDPDHSCIQPQISADGSLVTFVSQAFNLTPNAYTDADRVYAAVHFEITPEEQSVSGGAGGAATYDVITQQHTPWWIDWHEWQSWTDFETPPMGWGSGLLKVRANEANPDPTPRTATIKVFEKTVRFTQLAGLSLTSISPVEGPATGGTQVTFTGTGFEPGMRVVFDGLEATAVEFVSSTQLVATTRGDRGRVRQLDAADRDHAAPRAGDGLCRHLRAIPELAECLARRRVPLHRYDAAGAVVRIQRRTERERLVPHERDARLGLVGSGDAGHLDDRVRYDRDRGRHARHHVHVHGDERRRLVVALGVAQTRRDRADGDDHQPGASALRSRRGRPARVQLFGRALRRCLVRWRHDRSAGRHIDARLPDVLGLNHRSRRQSGVGIGGVRSRVRGLRVSAA